jgi:hypothetical protein
MAHEPSPARGSEEAVAQSEAHINDYLFSGGPDTEMEDVEIAEKFGVANLVKAAWADAKEMLEAWEEHAKRSVDVNEAEAFSFLSQTQPTIDIDAVEIVEPKPATKPSLRQRRSRLGLNRLERGVPHSLGSERSLTMAILLSFRKHRPTTAPWNL